jgi:hypothetical protein
MKLHLLTTIAALSVPAHAQVQHTHHEVWVGGATSEDPFVGGTVGFAALSWPAVMGWWLGGGWPSVALESTTVLDFVVPPDPSGAPVRYGFESYIHLNNYWDVGGPYWFENDVLVDTWTPGGAQGHPVHWESTRDITGGPALGEAAMRGVSGLEPVRIVSQVGRETGPPPFPPFDAWYVDQSGAQVGVGATIDVQTSLTLSWTFDPPAITHWDSGDVGCGAIPNSTGLTGRLEIGGSPALADDSMFVSAWNLPPASWGIIVQAEWFGSAPPPPYTGQICLGGPGLGRLHVAQANASGEIAWRLPTSQFLVTYSNSLFRTYFQLWHRDATPTGSNVTNAYRVRYEPL